jgi:hypothetical protein
VWRSASGQQHDDCDDQQRHAHDVGHVLPRLLLHDDSACDVSGLRRTKF